MSDKRLDLAIAKKAELEAKLEKVKGTPREEEFKLQLEKIDGLITHLNEELNEQIFPFTK